MTSKTSDIAELEHPQISSSQTLKDEPSSNTTPLTTPTPTRTVAASVPGSSRRQNPPKRRGRPPKRVVQPKALEVGKEKHEKQMEAVDLMKDLEKTYLPKKKNTTIRLKASQAVLTPRRETRAMKRKLDEVYGGSRDGMGDFERMLFER